MSIDEETRPIGTRPRTGTVSLPIFRCRSTASTTHGVPAAGRRFARREFARQPLLRETQEWEGGGLSRVQPLLGVKAKQVRSGFTPVTSGPSKETSAPKHTDHWTPHTANEHTQLANTRSCYLPTYLPTYLRGGGLKAQCQTKIDR